MMHAVRLAAGSLCSKAGVSDFNRAERDLIDKINGIDPHNRPADIAKLAQKILSLGGKRTYDPPKR